MQTVTVPTARHQTSCKFVHDNNFTILYDVIYITLINSMSAQRLLDVMHFFKTLFGKDVFHTEQTFHFFDALLGERCNPLLFILIIMRVFLQLTNELGVLHILHG